MSAGGCGARSSEPGAAQADTPEALVKDAMDAEEYDMPQHGQEHAPPPDLSLVKVEVEIDYDDQPEESEQAWQTWNGPGPELDEAKTEAGAQEPDPLLHVEAPPMPWDLLAQEDPLMGAEEEPPAAPGASSHATVGGMLIKIGKKAMSDPTWKRNKERPKKFKCDQCEYRTAVCSHFKRHMRTHTGEKPFACNLCEYRTAQKFNLKQHIMTHTGEKPFRCSLCAYGTANSKDLKQHMRTHTGEKPFSCDQCEYRANQIIHLVNHYRTHTGEKPFGCDLCEYRTTRSSHLKRHMMGHTGEKPFKCDQCEYAAVRSSDLKRHLKIHIAKNLEAN